MASLFLQSWQNILRVALSALMIYPLIVLAVRISGKRTTANMNNFDWIVTVALGAIIGSSILLKDVALLETVTAVGMLMLLQYGVTRLSFKSKRLSQVTRAKASLLYYDGQFDDIAMRQERVLRSEIEAAMRESGYVDRQDVMAVVLENNGRLSVLPRSRSDNLLAGLK